MKPIARITGVLLLLTALLGAGSTAYAVEGAAKGSPRFTTTGSGDALVQIPKAYKPIIVSATHDGTANFIVKGLSRDGQKESLLVNEIGPYSGTVLEDMGTFSGFTKKNPLVALEIKADGNWTVRTRPLAAAPRDRQGTGMGDQVIKLRKPVKGLKKVAFTHNGTSNFIVKAVDRKGDTDLLVNEIGAYEGSGRIPPGTRYLSIKADGDWTYSIS